MTFSIKVDKSVWENLKRNMMVGNNLENATGFFPESVYPTEDGGQQVAQIARDNNEGTVKNPTRPFMTVGFGTKFKTVEYEQLFKQAVSSIALGTSTATQEYTKLSPIFAKDLKQIIIEWSTPPNSPATIAAKGFNDPLIKSGLMRDSVQSKVETKE